MSEYSTKKADDGSYSVVDSLGFVVSTGWSEADADYQAQRHAEADRGNDNTTKDAPPPDLSPPPSPDPQSPPSPKPRGRIYDGKQQAGIPDAFKKIVTFLGCAVVLIVGIFVALGIVGWAIANFVVK